MPPRLAPSFLSAPPRDLREIADFPEYILQPGAEVHRIHLATFDPWYFNGEDTWRFNPCSISGLGACYLTERPVAGLLETFKGSTVVDEQDVARRAHFSTTLTAAVRLADCCVAAAGEFGVNGEIHSTIEYDRTQAWASAFATAGFAGVRYFCRSDPAMSLIGFALFDALGEAPPGRWPAGCDVPINDDILHEAEDYGLKMRPAP